MAYLIHLASGGLTHMMRLVGNSMSYCASRGLKIGIHSQSHQAFRLPFREVFSLIPSSGLEEAAEFHETLILNIDGDKINLSDIKVKYKEGDFIQ